MDERLLDFATKLEATAFGLQDTSPRLFDHLRRMAEAMKQEAGYRKEIVYPNAVECAALDFVFQHPKRSPEDEALFADTWQNNVPWSRYEGRGLDFCREYVAEFKRLIAARSKL